MEPRAKRLDNVSIISSKSRTLHLRQMRRWAWKYRINPKSSLTACGLPAETQVQVVNGKNGNHFRSLWSCKLLHECPVCAARIQAERCREIARVIKEPDRYCVYLSLTLAHSKEDKLKPLIKILAKCWNRIRAGVFGSRCKKFGEIAYVKSLDITYGTGTKGHGWHSHYGALLIFDRELTKDQIAELKEKCLKSWIKALKLDGRTATEKGFYLEALTGNKDATANYLAKINNIAWEVGSNTFKKGKTASHLNPWQILEMAGGKSPYFIKLWQEYLQGIKGSRSIQYSRSWKKLVEDLPEEPEPEEPTPTLVIRASLYKHLRKNRDDDRVLEVCDRASQGDTEAQMILKGIKRVSNLCPVGKYKHFSYEKGYEEEVWDPLHKQLSLFCR
jgi:hypothetical protein